MLESREGALVDALVHMLADRTMSDRGYAAEALGRLGPGRCYTGGTRRAGDCGDIT